MKTIYILLCIFLMVASCYLGYNYGTNEGYSSGYDTRYVETSIGYTEEDLEANFEKGRMVGYVAGLAEADSAYKEGYAAGLEDGKAQQSTPLTKPVLIPPSSEFSSNSVQTTPSSSQAISTNVYINITNTGEKYHRWGCQYLLESQVPILLDSAKAQGYTACSRCW